MHPDDYQLIKKITSIGIPVVAILLSGRPLVINAELEKSAAFIAAWLPGSEGQGISDLLFGDSNFQGKLSFAWPSTSLKADIKCATPSLFPLGFGLTTK